MAKRKPVPIRDILGSTGSKASRLRAVALETQRRKLRSIFGFEVKMGDLNPRAFDCSEWTAWLYNLFGYDLPDGSWNQWSVSRPLKSGEVLRAGDLFFLRKKVLTRKGWAWRVFHVGVYIGSDQWMEFRGRLYGSVVMNTAGIKKRGGIFRRVDRDAHGRKVLFDVPQAKKSTKPKSAYGVLQRGRNGAPDSRGAAVKAVQEQLAIRPYDGIYDKNVEAGVLRFQKDSSGLIPTGRVTPEDYKAIMHRPEICERGRTPKAWVRVIQRAVGAETDAVWGDETDRKVAAFQRRHGLDDDKVVGPLTWAQIEEG